jgi:N-acyl-D-amino-acid deacylase
MPLLLAFLLAVSCSAPTASPDRAAPSASSPASSADFDVIIRGGDVIDGSGSPRRRADVALRGDTIVEIGDLTGRTAKVTLDASGLVVAPGFIDLLGNSQSAVLIDPNLEGKIRQGVTTEVTGEGHSPAPIDDAMRAEMERTKPPGWPAVTWTSLADFMRLVEKRGTALNFAFYIGATNPREIVLGHAERAPDAAELARMTAIVEQARREGAVGVASALIYPPGRFATSSELTALARAGGSYWTHLRNEGSAIDSAIDEALRISRDAAVPLNIFHLKVGGRENWGRMPAIVKKIEAARSAAQDVASCVYPYTATSTALTSIVPAWALEGGYAAFVGRLGDAATRARIVDALRSGRLANHGASTILVRGLAPAVKQFESKRLDAVAREMNVEPAEAAVRLFAAGTNSPVGIYFSLDENDMKTALVQPWVAVCSDSGAVVGEARKSGAHPRAYGTFPRILRYVREEKLMTLEETVRKMTSLAASRAGLTDRGIIRQGLKADLVVFDPARIKDVSTYEDPHHYAEGVRHVVVNGKPVLQDGRMTGALPGRIVRPGAK